MKKKMSRLIKEFHGVDAFFDHALSIHPRSKQKKIEVVIHKLAKELKGVSLYA